MERDTGMTNGTEARWERWKRVSRRIRVPLGFIAAAVYLLELWRRAPQPGAIAWSLALVVPGLWLRGYAAGYVKKNRELTVTGPYAYTRNPLYLGSLMIAVGFAVALNSWPIELMLALGFAFIYIPVIAAEEQFLRRTFAGFEDYSRQVPRLIPRLTAARMTVPPHDTQGAGQPDAGSKAGFSLELYLKHREYNAAIGAALLYLSLLFLRPVLAAIIH